MAKAEPRRLTPKQLLAATCPHGSVLGKCQQSWCRGRVEDLLHGEYEAKLPEILEEAKP